MDFAISEKMQIIIKMIDEFVEKELIPLEPEFLSRPTSELLPRLKEKQKLVKQMELWAPCHPKKYGGMGLNLMEHALVSEALGRSPLGHFIFWCQAPDVGNIEILDLFATKAQKDQYLLPPGAGGYQKLLFHDRSQPGRLKSPAHGHHRCH